MQLVSKDTINQSKSSNHVQLQLVLLGRKIHGNNAGKIDVLSFVYNLKDFIDQHQQKINLFYVCPKNKA